MRDPASALEATVRCYPMIKDQMSDDDRASYLGLVLDVATKLLDEIRNDTYDKTTTTSPQRTGADSTEAEDVNLSLCPWCGNQADMIPAGVSKKTGKPYPAFYVCKSHGYEKVSWGSSDPNQWIAMKAKKVG